MDDLKGSSSCILAFVGDWPALVLKALGPVDAADIDADGIAVLRRSLCGRREVCPRRSRRHDDARK